MIYLIYGEDTQLVSKEMATITKDIDQNNLINLFEPFDFNTLRNEALTQPFLAEKKAIITRGVFLAKDKTLLNNIDELLPKLPECCDLIFIEQKKPDLRTSLYKTIVKIGKVIQLSDLTEQELTKWILNKTKELSGQIDFKTAQKLSVSCSNDLNRTQNELIKLLSYNKNVTSENIDKLIKSDFNESIFQLTDALSTKNRKASLVLLDQFLKEGENEAYLLSMFTRQIRNLLTIKDLEGMSESEIVSMTKFHPYVVKKTLQQTKRFSKAELLKIHQQLLETDAALKTGATEPKVAITQLVTSIVK